MMDTLTENFRMLPSTLGWHMLLSLAALATGVLISVPLGVAAVRRPKLAGWSLGAAGVMQTIPSIALLAFMVPVFALLLSPIPGGARYAIGFWPAYVALSLYSILPVLRNTVTGMAGVDRRLIEAARGVGMTERQMLMRVQLPLAMPVIVAGVRTAAVLTVGVATLATPVGATCLGDYIFGGLSTQKYSSVLFGCVFAALMALGLDGLIRLIESGFAERARHRVIVGITLLSLFATASVAYPIITSVAELFRARAVVVGGKTFTEQFILAEALADRLRAAGYRTHKSTNLGSTVLYESLRTNAIDAYIDYTGTIWATIMARTDPPDRARVMDEVSAFMLERDGIVCLGGLGFENTYALAMRREQAERLNIRTIDDLRTRARELRIGSDYEFFQRNEWRQLRDTYELEFADRVTLEPNLMYEACRSGAVDVVTSYSTDGRIVAFDLVVLEDTRQVFPPYDAIILLSPRAAADERIVEALKPLIGAVDDDAMRSANAAVDIEGRSPEVVGRELDR
jgi:osmoprotectant transport system permease protein